MAKKNKKSDSFLKYIKWFWYCFVGGVVFIVALFFLASIGAFGD